MTPSPENIADAVSTSQDFLPAREEFITNFPTPELSIANAPGKAIDSVISALEDTAFNLGVDSYSVAEKIGWRPKEVEEMYNAALAGAGLIAGFVGLAAALHVYAHREELASKTSKATKKYFTKLTDAAYAIAQGKELIPKASKAAEKYLARNEKLFLWNQQRKYENKFSDNREERRKYRQFEGKINKLFGYCSNGTQKTVARGIIVNAIESENPYATLSSAVREINPNMSTSEMKTIAHKYISN
ncbi:hypothetical protein ACFL0W_00225 [Nanoarchaeota archaeon]